MQEKVSHEKHMGKEGRYVATHPGSSHSKVSWEYRRSVSCNQYSTYFFLQLIGSEQAGLIALLFLTNKLEKINMKSFVL